jgi:hypothetical protein
MPVKNDSYFRHLKAGEKDYKRSDSGGLFMLVTKTGSKLWRYAYNFDAKQKLLAIGQYPLISLADARIKRDNAKRLLADDIDPSVERKAERRQARMARSNMPSSWPRWSLCDPVSSGSPNGPSLI